MKNNKALEIIDNLLPALNEIDAINKHPFSTGVNIEKFISEMLLYLNSCKQEIENAGTEENAKKEKNAAVEENTKTEE